MTLIGVIMVVAGLAGAAANHFGILQLGGALGDMKLWLGIAVAGGVVALLTRRASD